MREFDCDQCRRVPIELDPPCRHDFTIGICIDDDRKLISRLECDLIYDRSGTRPAQQHSKAKAHLPRRQGHNGWGRAWLLQRPRLIRVIAADDKCQRDRKRQDRGDLAAPDCRPRIGGLLTIFRHEKLTSSWLGLRDWGSIPEISRFELGSFEEPVNPDSGDCTVSPGRSQTRCRASWSPLTACPNNPEEAFS